MILRAWQHARLRSEAINVAGVLVRLDEEGFVIDESALTAEAIADMVAHKNWSQADRDSGRALRERLALARVREQRSLKAVEEAESGYRSAYEAYEKARGETEALEAALAQEGGVEEAVDPPAATPARKSKFTSEQLAILANPALIKDTGELKSAAALFGIKVSGRSRSAVESDMKALYAAETKE